MLVSFLKSIFVPFSFNEKPPHAMMYMCFVVGIHSSFVFHSVQIRYHNAVEWCGYVCVCVAQPHHHWKLKLKWEHAALRSIDTFEIISSWWQQQQQNTENMNNTKNQKEILLHNTPARPFARSLVRHSSPYKSLFNMMGIHVYAAASYMTPNSECTWTTNTEHY